MTNKKFFGRDTIIRNIQENLEECSNKYTIIGLYGMGGFGKTAILQHCRNLARYSIYVDFKRVKNPIHRLQEIALGARHVGLSTPRFDCLLDTHNWFLNRTKPTSKSKGWIKDLVNWITPISQMVKIAAAIITAGSKLNQAISKHHEKVGKWLQSRLGLQYGKQLLQMLAETPEAYLELMMSALAADLNYGPADDLPVLILLDEFNEEDDKLLVEIGLEQYGFRQKESELWQLFLSGVSGSVSIIAGRNLPSITTSFGINRTDYEIKELDIDSSIKILESRGIHNTSIADRIAEICHYNPEVLHSLCDVWKRGELNITEIDSLRSDDLYEVRTKIWNYLMSRAPALVDIANKAAFLPFFDEKTLSIVMSDLDPSRWSEFIGLSFVEFSDPYWNLHDLAREVALGEYRNNLAIMASSIRDALVSSFERSGNLSHAGFAVFAESIIDDNLGCEALRDICNDLHTNERFYDSLTILDSARLVSDQGRALTDAIRAQALVALNRITEAESSYLRSLEYYESRYEQLQIKYQLDYCNILNNLGSLYNEIGKTAKSKELLNKALILFNELSETGHVDSRLYCVGPISNLGKSYMNDGAIEDALCILKIGEAAYYYLIQEGIKQAESDLALLLTNLGIIYDSIDNIPEAKRAYEESLRIRRHFAQKGDNLSLQDVGETLCNLGPFYRRSGDLVSASTSLKEAEDIFLQLSRISPDVYQSKLASVLNNLSSVLIDQGKLEDALDCTNRAMKINTELETLSPELYTQSYVRTLENKAMILFDLGRRKEAISNFEDCIPIQRDLAKQSDRHVINLASSLANLGSLYLKLNNFSSAKDMLLEANDIYRKIMTVNPDLYRRKYARNLTNLGVLFRNLYDKDRSEHYFDLALKEYTLLEIKAPEYYKSNIAYLHNNKGILYTTFNLDRKALKSFEEALQIHRLQAGTKSFKPLSYVASTLLNIGNVYIKLGKNSDAITVLDEALGIQEELDKISGRESIQFGELLIARGSASYKERDYPSAELYYSDAIKVIRKVAKNDPFIFATRLVDVLSSLGGLYVDTGDLTKARTHLDDALKISEKSEKTNPLSNTRRTILILYNKAQLEKTEGKTLEAYNCLKIAVEKFARIGLPPHVYYNEAWNAVCSGLVELKMLISGCALDEAKNEIKIVIEKIMQNHSPRD